MHIIDKNFFKTSILPINLLEQGIVKSIPPSAVHQKKVKARPLFILDKKSDFYTAQLNIIEQFLNNVELNDCAKGFRKNSSYLHFLEPHSGNYQFLRLDIKNFFHSIDEFLLKKCFSSYFRDEFIDGANKQKLINSFVNLVTYYVPSLGDDNAHAGKRIVPVGFPTSPQISNIYFRSADIQLQKLCSALGITYTRYADDLLFSSSRDSGYIHSSDFEKEVRIILGTLSLKLNNKKIIKVKHRISLNGYIIQSRSKSKKSSQNDFKGVFISQKKTALIEKVLHEMSQPNINYIKIMEKILIKKIKKGDFYFPLTRVFIVKYYKSQTLNYLAGYRSYLISLLKFNETYKCIPKIKTDRYITIIDKIELYLK